MAPYPQDTALAQVPEPLRVSLADAPGVAKRGTAPACEGIEKGAAGGPPKPCDSRSPPLSLTVGDLDFSLGAS